MKDDRIIDYFSPPPANQRNSFRVIMSGFFGALLGVFSLTVLFYGIGGIAWLAKDWRHADGGDVFAVVVMNIIGLFSGAVAIRWIRVASGRAENQKKPADAINLGPLALRDEKAHRSS